MLIQIYLPTECEDNYYLQFMEKSPVLTLLKFVPKQLFDLI